MEEHQKNEEIKNKIYEYLKEGMFKKDAAIMAGISEATLYRWIEEDESFESRIQAGILEYKHSLVKNITASSVKDGRLALEVLRRRFPREWGNNANLQDNDDHDQSIKKLIETFEKLIFDRDNKEDKPIQLLNGENLPENLNTENTPFS